MGLLYNRSSFTNPYPLLLCAGDDDDDAFAARLQEEEIRTAKQLEQDRQVAERLAQGEARLPASQHNQAYGTPQASSGIRPAHGRGYKGYFRKRKNRDGGRDYRDGLGGDSAGNNTDYRHGNGRDADRDYRNGSAGGSASRSAGGGGGQNGPTWQSLNPEDVAAAIAGSTERRAPAPSTATRGDVHSSDLNTPGVPSRSGANTQTEAVAAVGSEGHLVIEGVHPVLECAETEGATGGRGDAEAVQRGMAALQDQYQRGILSTQKVASGLKELGVFENDVTAEDDVIADVGADS